MGTVIKVVLGYELSTYGSLEEATNQPKPDLSYKKVNGNSLLSYQFDGSTLVFEFDNDMSLVVSCGDLRVHWCVTAEKYALSKSAENDVEFELPSGTRFKWNWKENLDGFLGKKLTISPSDQLLFLLVNNTVEYIVNVYSQLGAPENKFLDISEA